MLKRKNVARPSGFCMETDAEREFRYGLGICGLPSLFAKKPQVIICDDLSVIRIDSDGACIGVHRKVDHWKD